MDLEDFIFRPWPVNTAIDAILAQLMTAVDDNAQSPKRLLESAERTIAMGMEDIIASLTPSPEECPCVRSMGGKGRYPIEGVTFIRADGYIILPLYFIYHSQKPKFEQLREAHINTCIRFLEQPMDDDMRGMDRTEDLDWFYKIASWDLNIDHDTPLKYLRMVNLQPPFYCSRVDLEIQVNVIQQ